MMWIFCGGMPRAGSTLQFQLTAHLVEQAGLGTRVEWVRPPELAALISRHSATPGLKVCKTHVCTPEVQAEFSRGNAKGVYVYRDVRDAIVSRMRKSGQSFDALERAGFLDRILVAFDAWTSLDGVLVSRYENLIADATTEVAHIAAHLGITLDRAGCERIAEQYSMDRQRERIEQVQNEGRMRQSGAVTYDPVSNLHVDHIRSGRSGEWRTVLSARELKAVDRRAASWLAAHGYAPSLARWERAVLLLQQAARHLRSLRPGGVR